LLLHGIHEKIKSGIMVTWRNRFVKARSARIFFALYRQINPNSALVSRIPFVLTATAEICLVSFDFASFPRPIYGL